MKATIYASFPDEATARSAMDALASAGFPLEDVTMVPSTVCRTGEQSEQEFGAMTGAFPDLAAGGQGSLMGDDTAYGMRYTGIAATANATVEPGSMTDYLWESLPSDLACDCRKELAAGRAIVIVRDATEQAVDILQANGVIRISEGKS